MSAARIGGAPLRIARTVLLVVVAFASGARRSDATQTTASPAAATQLVAAGPLALARAALASLAIEGIVVESLPAGPYRYVHLVDARGRDQWAVGIGLEARPGEISRFQLVARANGFQSPSLGRRFDRLHFVVPSLVP